MQSTSGNRKRNSSPPARLDGDTCKSPKLADARSPGNRNKRADSLFGGSTSNDEDEENQPAETVVRVDSHMGVSLSSTYEDLALLRNTAHELRAVLDEFKQISGSWRRHTPAPKPPKSPMEKWREAPERLEEEEKDALQLAIQEAHRMDLEEREKLTHAAEAQGHWDDDEAWLYDESDECDLDEEEEEEEDDVDIKLLG